MGFLRHVWVLASLAFMVNLPFGYWRHRSRTFSRPWFLAIHVPVVLLIGMRLLSGIGFSWGTFPLFFGVFFLGQALGGRLPLHATLGANGGGQIGSDSGRL